MKRIQLLGALVIALLLFLASPGSVSAHDYQRTVADNPARLLAYPVHALGQAVDWAIMRPVHWLASRPNARIIFGHAVNPDDVYFAWEEYH